MLNPPSINALLKLLENFLKFGQFFQIFFAQKCNILYPFKVATFTPIWSIPNFDQKLSN